MSENSLENALAMASGTSVRFGHLLFLGFTEDEARQQIEAELDTSPKGPRAIATPEQIKDLELVSTMLGKPGQPKQLPCPPTGMADFLATIEQMKIPKFYL